jgi:TATA-binding protein-associated factor
MLAVAQHQNELRKIIASDQKLSNLLTKGIAFQEGFAKMTKTKYALVAGIKPTVKLRDYQMEGIQWLGFLMKYNLNAALCDDMGLGKTL